MYVESVQPTCVLPLSSITLSACFQVRYIVHTLPFVIDVIPDAKLQRRIRLVTHGVTYRHVPVHTPLFVLLFTHDARLLSTKKNGQDNGKNG